MGYSSNIYSSPEKFGLKIFGSASNDESYQFDMLVVWEDAFGKLFFAHDKGCSCPIPFENMGVGDLILLTNQTRSRFEILTFKYGDGGDRLLNKIWKVIGLF